MSDALKNTARPTTGPWYSDAGEDHYQGHVIRKNGMLVCTMRHAAFGSHGDRFANADLIVAACNACQAINPDNPIACAEAIPEIIAALKHLIRYDFGDSQGAKEARAALAKAEGRPTP